MCSFPDMPPSIPADLAGLGECELTPGRRLEIARVAWLATGWLMTALAVAGVAVPVLPTTPFALIAVWAFARASPRMQAWLETHPAIGPLLRDWQARRAIPRRAKGLAVLSLALSWCGLVALGVAPGGLIGAAAVMLTVAGWIVTRAE